MDASKLPMTSDQATAAAAPAKGGAAGGAWLVRAMEGVGAGRGLGDGGVGKWRVCFRELVSCGSREGRGSA